MKREPLQVFLTKAIVLTCALCLLGYYAGTRFRVGIAGQENSCLPYKYYVIDFGSKKIEANGYVAFESDDRLEPHYGSGSLFIKQIRAIEGDVVKINDGVLSINKKNEGVFDANILQKIDKKPQQLDVDFVVLPGNVWVMGTSPDSFDSRYWGTVKPSQVKGRVYPLF